MKTLGMVWGLAIATASFTGFAAPPQTFRNMNFEQAIVADISNPFGGFETTISRSRGLPGWTLIGVQDQLYYNSRDLDVESVGLFDNEARLSGRYSLLLGACYPASFYEPDHVAGVAQIGTVPPDAQSIWLKASPFDLTLLRQWSGHPDVTQFTLYLNGQSIALQLQTVSPGYYTWAGDISGYAGTVSELALTLRSYRGAYNNPATVFGLMLDDISFSPQVIPEPSTVTLLALGLMSLIAARQRNGTNCVGK